MPIFEYKCRKCGHVQEIVVFKDNEQDHMPCLNCGVCLWEKMPTSPGLVRLDEKLRRL